LRVRQEPLAFVEPNGSCRNPETVGELSDQHLFDNTP
jgi:hypothetical protein